MDNETNQNLNPVLDLNQITPPEQKFFLKPKVIVLALVGVLILVGLAIGGYYYYFNGTPIESTVVSEVKVVDGVPKIFLNGKEFPVVSAQSYNYPDKTTYGPDWSSAVKKTIDTEKEVGANLFLLHLWWSDLDKFTSRPENLGDNLDFTYVDEVMDYANQKGMKMMLLTGMHTMIPEWWKNEEGISNQDICMPTEIGKNQTCIPKELCTADEKNCCNQDTEDLVCCDLAKSEPNFTTDPPTSPKIIAVTSDNKIFKCTNLSTGTSYELCFSCETDNSGWKYKNPSMGYDKAQADYGEYLTAVINRYKNHPALLGWQMQSGFSGEGFYGPNYIALSNLGNRDNLDKGRMTDYSKVFKDSFKVWLTEKYKTTTALKSSWNDSSVSLENFKIPLINEFFVDGQSHVFPDSGYLNYFITLNDLTKKGKDFYEFRVYMKAKDSKYYSNLFKSLDPNHALFFNSYDNIEEYTDTNINGYFGNWVLSAKGSENTYLPVLAYAIVAEKYSQLGLPSWENAGGAGKNNEDKKQLDTLEEAGKAMKCFGYDWGYVTALPGMGQDYPTWTSENARQVIKDIIAYSPTENCQCEFLSKSYTFHGKTIKQIFGMYNITDYDYCWNSSNEDGSTNTTTPCGDGICDDFESQNNACPEDCGLKI